MFDHEKQGVISDFKGDILCSKNTSVLQHCIPPLTVTLCFSCCLFKAPPPEYPVYPDWSAHTCQASIANNNRAAVLNQFLNKLWKCVTWWCSVSQGSRLKGGTTDETFQEQCFLWEIWASVGADFGLFKFQDVFHAQEPSWKTEKHNRYPLMCLIYSVQGLLWHQFTSVHCLWHLLSHPRQGLGEYYVRQVLGPYSSLFGVSGHWHSYHTLYSTMVSHYSPCSFRAAVNNETTNIEGPCGG